MKFQEIDNQIKKYIKENKFGNDILLYFSNNKDVDIKQVINIIYDNIKNIKITEINVKYLSEELIKNYIENYIENNKILFSGALLYIYGLNEKNQEKALKTLYYVIILNITFNIISIIDGYKKIDNEINKKTYKDIIIIIIFSMILSAVVSYSFYYYLGQFFS